MLNVRHYVIGFTSEGARARLRSLDVCPFAIELRPPADPGFITPAMADALVQNTIDIARRVSAHTNTTPFPIKDTDR